MAGAEDTAGPANEDAESDAGSEDIEDSEGDEDEEEGEGEEGGDEDMDMDEADPAKQGQQPPSNVQQQHGADVMVH